MHVDFPHLHEKCTNFMELIICTAFRSGDLCWVGAYFPAYSDRMIKA